MNKYKIKNPIIKKSYGILCSRYNLKTQKVETLLIQKRATFSYVEFVLKFQDRNNDSKLQYLFDHMTHEEKLDILSLDFGRMWYRLWIVNPDSSYTPENLKLNSEKYNKFAVCKNNFERNFLIDKGKKLYELIAKSQNIGSLWEIPKGRKAFPQEKDLVCAIREFAEETGILSDEYEIIEDKPIETSNHSFNIKYINYYYLAIMPGNTGWKYKNPKMNYGNIHQISEISEIAWMTLDKIEMIDTTGKLYELIKGINKLLRKTYKIKKLTEMDLLQPIDQIIETSTRENNSKNINIKNVNVKNINIKNTNAKNINTKDIKSINN